MSETEAPAMSWETLDEEALYPEPRYRATDGPDRYEIHYNGPARRWVLFQNGEAWRSTGGHGPVDRPATACHPRDLDAAKSMAEEMARRGRR